MFVSQSLPVRPGGQMQEKVAISSLHVEPPTQGFDSHSLMLTLQSFPAK